MAFSLYREQVSKKIIKQFTKATKVAEEAAATTAASWSVPRKEGGLAFMTYRATCIRK
jgi:hypothetical protein